jgi:alkylhydroperoxidase/carboxymuconolactone decarboxylase family protein YurZ
MDDKLPEPQLDEAAIDAFREPYRELLGFVPPRIGARIEQLAGLDPEWLALQEEVRRRAMYPDCLDQKTAQLMLFGMLLILLRDAAKTHGIAARRAGASWEEMQAVVNLAYLFGGLSCANRGAQYLEAISEHEAREAAA